MRKKPSYRSRILNMLRTAVMVGQAGVSVAVLASILDTDPRIVVAAMLPDMLETPTGATPPVYCDPHGPTLVLRDGTEGAA